MATELYVQQVIPGGYTVATANQTGLSAGKQGFFYTFPSRYGAVDIYGFSVRADGIATATQTAGLTPAAVFSVWDPDETNFLNGYFPAPVSEVYGTTIGLAGQAVLDTPIRISLSETVNVGFPDFVTTTEVGGWSLFSAFLFRPTQ